MIISSNTVRASAPLLACTLALIAVLELGCTIWMAFPPRSEHSLLVRRNYYYRHERRIVQFDPACSRYDPALLYTLRPGKCRFKNREFDTIVEVNSAGFRDDEESLNHPEAIITGDSVAMGWGVEQQESFPQLLEQRLRRRILNAAVSSYGTHRELLALKKVPMDRTRVLLIQYSANDFEENDRLLQVGRYTPMSEAAFHAAISTSSSEYFPGTYFFGLLPEMIRVYLIGSSRNLGMTARTAGLIDREARVFLETAARGIPNDAAYSIIVLEQGPWGSENGEFLHSIDRQKSDSTFPRAVQELLTIDTAGITGPSDYFLIDEHPTASAHRKVADALEGPLQRALTRHEARTPPAPANRVPEDR